MKIIFNSKTMADTLAKMMPIVGHNSVLPICENFLLVSEGPKLTITATDLSTAMIAELTVAADAKNKNGITVCVPGKILFDTLKGLGNQPITLQVGEDDSFDIQLISTNGAYKINGEDPKNYPKTPTLEAKVTAEIDAKVLKSAIDYTSFCIGNNELMTKMSGLSLKTSENDTIFRATDGHRLTEYLNTSIVFSGISESLIPKKTATILSSFLKEGIVEITISDKFISCTYDSLTLIGRLIDENFPNTDGVFSDTLFTIELNRVEMLNSLKRILSFSEEETKLIVMQPSSEISDSVKLIATDYNYGNEAEENIPCQIDEEIPENYRIGFNGKYMIEQLSVMKSDIVVLCMNLPNRSFKVLPLANEPNAKLVGLIMPQMIDHYTNDN